MPTITDEAVCIRRWDFSETSQTVSLLTREHGVIRGIAKGAKRDRGPFSGGLDVLTRGEVVAIVKPGRDLSTLTEWHLLEGFPAVRQRLDANRVGLYMADLIRHMLTDHDPHPRVFESVIRALRALREPNAIAGALLQFQWELLSDAGYQPEVDRDAVSGSPIPEDWETLVFSAGAGGLVSDVSDGTCWRVRRETVVVLQSLAAGETGVSARSEALDRANRLLAAYARELLGTEPATVSWLFSDLGVG